MKTFIQIAIFAFIIYAAKYGYQLYQGFGDIKNISSSLKDIESSFVLHPYTETELSKPQVREFYDHCLTHPVPEGITTSEKPSYCRCEAVHTVIIVYPKMSENKRSLAGYLNAEGDIGTVIGGSGVVTDKCQAAIQKK